MCSNKHQESQSLPHRPRVHWRDSWSGWSWTNCKQSVFWRWFLEWCPKRKQPLWMEISWQPWQAIFFGGICKANNMETTLANFTKLLPLAKLFAKSSPSTRLEQECMIDAVDLDRRFHMFSRRRFLARFFCDCQAQHKKKGQEETGQT